MYEARWDFPGESDGGCWVDGDKQSDTEGEMGESGSYV